MNEPETTITRRRFLATTGAVGTAVALGRARAAQPEPKAPDKPPPLIDCHLHINHAQRSVADTIKHMDATGTAKAFILPLETGEGGVLLKSDTVLEAYRQHRDRIIPFCQCDVRQANAFQRVREYQRLGCRGVGEQKEHVPLNDRRIEGLIALCNELDWPITIHFQDGKNGFNQGLAENLEPYLKRYPRVRIIGHAQTWWAHISAEVPPPEQTLYPKGPVKRGGVIDRLLGDYANLYADLSAGSGYNALARDEEFTAGFLERHRKKLLFGSDCPCWDGRGGQFREGCYSVRLQKFLRQKVRDEQALHDMFHDNAMRALNGNGK
jgi:hypothetical protein